MKNHHLVRLVLVLAIGLTIFSSIPKTSLIGVSTLSKEQQEAFDSPQAKRNGANKPSVTSSSEYNTSSTKKLSICFLTAVYAKWAAHADKLQNVTRYNQDFQFFVYTNLRNLKAKGWTKVVKTHANYNRFITQSRWPKFLGWQDPIIVGNSTTGNGGCDVVFYMDSIGKLIANASAYRQMASEIYNSPVGLAQYKHSGGRGAFGEFRRIEVFQKDLPANIQASKEWLLNQSDFRPYNCTLYENRYFGYRVSSQAFRRASQFLWNHYSLEQDSWRDQPLWCYVVDHFNITPIELRHKELFKISPSRMGKAKHRYGANSETDAQEKRQEDAKL